MTELDFISQTTITKLFIGRSDVITYPIGCYNNADQGRG